MLLRRLDKPEKAPNGGARHRGAVGTKNRHVSPRPQAAKTDLDANALQNTPCGRRGRGAESRAPATTCTRWDGFPTAASVGVGLIEELPASARPPRPLRDLQWQTKASPGPPARPRFGPGPDAEDAGLWQVDYGRWWASFPIARRPFGDPAPRQNVEGSDETRRRRKTWHPMRLS